MQPQVLSEEEEEEEEDSTRLRVLGLFRYPLKSGGASVLQTAALARDGLEGDRRWMVTTRGGAFLSQRDRPKLAMISADLHDRMGSDGAGLTLRAPKQQPLNVSIATSEARTRALLWGDTISLEDEGDAAAGWLSRVLGGASGSVLSLLQLPRYRLLRVPASGIGRRAGLADVSPVHLLCEASVAALNAQRAAQGLPPVSADRFRPNMLISGCAPFEEDAWDGCVSVGDTTLRIDSPCPRCTLPDVNQQTGTFDGPPTGPMRSLRLLRQSSGAVNFGIYLTPTAVPGTVSVGDTLRIHPCVLH